MERDGTRCSYPNRILSHILLQGWKGSVKATNFVIALHDHFTAKVSRKTFAETSSAGVPAGTVNNINTDVDTTLLPDTSAEDSWALEHINISLVHPLIEAIDNDGSSFVTVNELNDFTSSRPEKWRRVRELTIDYSSLTLTYNQSSSLDRILDGRLRDDDELVLATGPKELGSYCRGVLGDASCKSLRLLSLL